MLLVDAAHQSGSRGKDLIHEDENSLLGRKLDPLADDVDELADCQVRGDQVLLLVDGSDVALLDLFADDLCWETLAIKMHPQAGRPFLGGMTFLGCSPTNQA